MRKLLLMPLMLVSLALGHTIESAGAPPADLNPAIAGMLQKDGIRVLDTGKKVVAELWFRSTMPSGPKSAEDAVTLATVPHGSLLGVIRFPERSADRRGQSLKPGLYTLRFSMYPQNGDHQGVEPQRDFLVLSPAADDKDPNTNPKFDALIEQSRKASGTPHPAVLSFWKSDAGATPSIAAGAEGEWVLQTKIGDTSVSVIVVGKNAH
jgi:hypothetical protein